MLQEKQLGLDTATRDLLQDEQQLNSIEDGVPGDGVGNENNNPEAESELNETDLFPKSDDDVLRLIATAAPESQEWINRLNKQVQECQGENQVLKAELKKQSLLEDKQKRCEEVVQLSREHAADVASDEEENSHGGVGHQQQPSK